MILKIAGILYILFIIIVYLVVIIFDTKRFITLFKNKKHRKIAVQEIFSLVLLIPVMPFMVLIHFLEEEYDLYL